MPKKYFDFFRIVTEPQINFYDLLNDIAQREHAEKRLIVCDKVATLKESTFSKGVYSYIFLRIRMDSLPPIVKADGTVRPLNLEIDDGLGEYIALAIHPDINVVSIQRNRLALSTNNIISYIKYFCDKNIDISLLPILKQDALVKFNSMGVLRKFRFKVAGTNDLSFLKNIKISTSEKLKLEDYFAEPNIDITVSVGRSNSELEPRHRSLINSLLQVFSLTKDQNIVKKIIVSGKEDEESDTEMVDLIRDRLSFEAEVKEENRTIDIKDLQRVAISSILSNMKYLRERVCYQVKQDII